ncbi:MAG: hypothetical protein IZT59_12105 [Verrucomicrobia bacterium]|jgi:glucose/arabinose dehydrogenase|nr:hypothetical protein [Verrucomicrobiota bacterium]|tara:strand:- start:8974 stop:10434 length:1461 start_codon:yes stop_codon:yes gene_type:complete
MRPLLLLAALTATSFSQTQSDFYLREEIPLPEGEIMEISSIALMPDEQVAVATRRGDIWVCSGAYGEDLSKVTWKKFAGGLHEPLGMFYKDGSLFLTQRPEFSRIQDTDGNGEADVFETINSGWGISGDYHEYAFGSRPDPNGDVWVTLCLTGSFNPGADWRGWTMRITPDGKMIPTCSGIRSPGGIGQNAEGDMFYTDNQGTWNGSSSLKWLKPGSFQGNPTANKYHKLANLPAPPEVESGSRVLKEHLKYPEYIPPAVVFPHAKVGQSPTGIAVDTSGGKFGPWENQLYVGEQTHSQIQRVCLEKINGIYQGAVFLFLEGFESGLIPVRYDNDKGIIFGGGSNRGWASRGSKKFTFERAKWTGKTPFEILTMSAKPDGFVLNFTEPVEEKSATDLKSYSMEAWTYILQKDYGSPEVDQATPVIKKAVLSPDKKSVRLTIEGLVRGHVHHLNSSGVKSASGQGLWHKDAYYTLNEIPKIEVETAH